MLEVKQDKITLSTDKPLGFYNVADGLRAVVLKHGLQNGCASIISRHTTCAICINEECVRLQNDMVSFLEKTFPADADYEHNRSTVDGRNNAHAHLMALFLKAGETIPVTGGELALGAWQSIFFVELDGPRNNREIFVTLTGEFK